MSKVICDVCGTTYPETAQQCPICGCAKNTTAQTAAGDGAQSAGETSYAYVKGGRFSKSNVRKRNKTGKEPERQMASERPAKAERQPKEEKKDNTNKILAVIVVILLLAIVAVLVYMGLRVFFPDLGKPVDPSDNNTTQITESTESTESTGTSTPLEIPCTSVKLSRSTIEFLKAGDGYLLAATVAPADTTDSVVYESSDEDVVTVTDGGMITAVSGGQAVIIVTCGDQTAECQIICSFGEYQAPTETAPSEPDVQIPEGFVLKLNRTEFSLTAKYPNPWALYKETMGVKATDITWTVDDPKVASVDENGVVSAVGRGWTTVRATIGDQTASCKVNVSFDPKPATEPKYKLSHTDVTLYVGDPTLESFRITLTDKEGVNIDAEWTVSDEGYVTINGRNITAVKSTSDLAKRAVTVSATVDGETYTCTVRVAEKPTEETQSGT